MRTEPGAAYGLIGAFAAEVDAIAAAEQGFAGPGNSLNFHRQPGCVAAHDNDAWSSQWEDLESREYSDERFSFFILVGYFRVVALGMKPGSESFFVPRQEISRPVSEILRQTTDSI
jgi:hypothetical protein